MRSLKASILAGALLVLMVPAPAHAWFGWLDNLSGPGPFHGLEFDVRLACFMDQPTWSQAAAATTVVKSFTETLLKSPPKTVQPGTSCRISAVVRPS